MLKCLTSEDYAFIREELIDVLDLIPEDKIDRACLKLDRLLMALKLVKEELSRGPQKDLPVAGIDSDDYCPSTIG